MQLGIEREAYALNWRGLKWDAVAALAVPPAKGAYYSKAYELYESALKVDCTYSPAEMNRCFRLVSAGKYTESLDGLKRVQANHPYDANCIGHISTAASNSESYADVLELSTKSFEALPCSLTFSKSMATAGSFKLQHREAERYIDAIDLLDARQTKHFRGVLAKARGALAPQNPEDQLKTDEKKRADLLGEAARQSARTGLTGFFDRLLGRV